MSNQMNKQTRSEAFRVMGFLLLTLGLFSVSGCNELDRDDDDGFVANEIELPTDSLLNLSCADMGIYTETCVLTDPDNPFRTALIREFDVNNATAETKFDLLNQIPPGPNYAKARVYFWATAMARRASGENQWFLARAMHELFNVNGDPVIQAQALRAYQSVLQNFFGSVVFFECCANVNPSGNPVPFSIPLNELAADDVYRTAATGFARLVPGDPLLALSLISEWGFSYQPATPPNFDNGVVSINEG
ncbi:MAG: hypothetical protein AB8G18_04980 [Gammaproteobacteria bacterium]